MTYTKSDAAAIAFKFANYLNFKNSILDFYVTKKHVHSSR
jgi:hypothetical protein